MEISFVLDFASFWFGFGSAFVVSFLGLLVVAGLQYRKQKRLGGRK